MADGVGAILNTELDDFIAAYEAARAQRAPADLSAFLPEPGHRLFKEVLRELVRVDLEYGWTSGCPRTLDDYRKNYPQFFEDPDDLRAIAFEEYRLRHQAGENPEPAEYRRRFGVDTGDWPTPQSLSEPPAAERRCCRAVTSSVLGGDREQDSFALDQDPCSYSRAGRFTPALHKFPELKSDFLGFQLIAELGRGAFGRVYLAQQGELADRPVALKISRDLRGEWRTLAQLHHTNIVPIHSVHHADPFHAVCMPFLGSPTLADLLQQMKGNVELPASGKALVNTFKACQSGTWRADPSHASPSPLDPPSALAEQGTHAGDLPQRAEQVARTLERLTYIEDVLWIGARLASGPTHAHERGILHRDLKPANVLVADDGQPMLLDFNLSEDIKLRADAPPQFIGGTLPYMAPEHLTAFLQSTATVDARSDLYALGVMLYELLTGRHPFPLRCGVLAEVLPLMLQDRHMTHGGFRKALPLWQNASFVDAQNIWAWYGLGNCHESLCQPAQAAASYSACIALDRGNHGWYFKRGLAQLRLKEYPLACADFDQAIRLQPGQAEAYINRALARLHLKRCAEAAQDLTQAIELGASDPRIYLIRAQAREKAGDAAGAKQDRMEM